MKVGSEIGKKKDATKVGNVIVTGVREANQSGIPVNELYPTRGLDTTKLRRRDPVREAPLVRWKDPLQHPIRTGGSAL